MSLSLNTFQMFTNINEVYKEDKTLPNKYFDLKTSF